MPFGSSPFTSNRGGTTQQQTPVSGPRGVQNMGAGGFAPQKSQLVYLPAFQLENVDPNRRRLLELERAARGADYGTQNIQNQADLISMLQARARGEGGPSVAEQQMKLAGDRNLAQAIAMQRSVGGQENVGTARRAISAERATQGQELAGQGAMLRAQEQQAAEQQLGQAIAQRQDMEMGAQALREQIAQFYVQQGLGLDMAQSQANMELQRFLAENENQAQATLASVGNSIRAAKSQKYSAPWGILSDENLKTNVQAGGDYLKGFLDTVGALKAYGNPTRSLLVGGMKSLGERATAAGSPILGQTLGEVGEFLASPKGYLIGKAIEGGKAIAKSISGAGQAAAQGAATGAAQSAAKGAAEGAAKGTAQAAGKAGASAVGGETAGSSSASTAQQLAGMISSLISGTKSTAGTYQNRVPVEGTLKQGSTSPKQYMVPTDENQGEIPNNQGIIGGILSALTSSGINMKENVAPANQAMSSFLQGAPNPYASGAGGGRTSSVYGTSQGLSTIPRYQVAETGITPRFTSGILETASDSVGGGRSNMWTGSYNDQVAASDEKKKKNEEGDPIPLREFLDHLKAYSYDYKEPEIDGEGRQFGVMAQDLEKSPVGASFVIDTPRGKMVDYGKGFGAILASAAMLNERMNRLEAKSGGK